MTETTLCYIEVSGKILMMHRTKKENDENKDKYIGLGGHFEPGETPEDCMLREVREECGLTLSDYRYRGIVDFHSDMWDDERMHLFTAGAQLDPLPACDEGELCLVTREKLLSLDLWEGDRIFLRLLFDGAPFFFLALYYRGQTLTRALLNGKELRQDPGRPS